MIDIHTILAHSVDSVYGNDRFLNLPSNQSIKSWTNEAKLELKHLDVAYIPMHMSNCLMVLLQYIEIV
jgi:hypothetical protein